MNQKELESKVRHIQVHSRKAVLELLAGEYRSCFKGMGVEFEDVRDYQHGDDVRTIDWNVTARTGRPHVKTFMEERELSLYFLIDVSGSGDFGSGTSTKREVAARVFALLAFASAHNHDNVGLILLSDDVECHVEPRKGKNHVMRMIDLVMRYEPKSQGTDIAHALDYLNQVRGRRCVAFLFSDFLDHGYEGSLGETARLHDLVCVFLSDLRERELPRSGMLEMMDAESGEMRTIDCSDGRLRRHVRAEALARQQKLKNLCHEVGADWLSLRTEGDYLHEIIRFFKDRNNQSADAK
ncbi:MAG: DUF58 domain-containing protein [Verrucomicrobiae bacterium]|nr:DUF58 domain-containing protein [Verrucomicrobiae bacterium]NNJ43442.1 DUF58 domain-containing protein [Akkermansiaceae bacterium]